MYLDSSPNYTLPSVEEESTLYSPTVDNKVLFSTYSSCTIIKSAISSVGYTQHVPSIKSTSEKYKRAMFAKTNTELSPWKVIRANRKTEARVNVINHILKRIPYDKDLEI